MIHSLEYGIVMHKFRVPFVKYWKFKKKIRIYSPDLDNVVKNIFILAIFSGINVYYNRAEIAQSV
jgi:hypothetical protein